MSKAFLRQHIHTLDQLGIWTLATISDSLLLAEIKGLVQITNVRGCKRACNGGTGVCMDKINDPLTVTPSFRHQRNHIQ